MCIKVNKIIIFRTANKNQVIPLYLITYLTIKSQIAFSQQFTYRKMYAPEFAHDPIEEFLEDLKPFNVVAVRKRYTDSDTASIPLYVLTVIGTPPNKMQKMQSMGSLKKGM